MGNKGLVRCFLDSGEKEKVAGKRKDFCPFASRFGPLPVPSAGAAGGRALPDGPGRVRGSTGGRCPGNHRNRSSSLQPAEVQGRGRGSSVLGLAHRGRRGLTAA